MGSSASKSELVKTFTPATPVEFSPEFLQKLESSEESNFARSQLTEKFIQKEVAKRLAQIQKEGDLSLQKGLKEALNKSEAGEDISSAKLEAKVTELSEKLEAVKNSKFFQQRTAKEANPQIEEARTSVVKCLTDNKSKPLNCWDEMQTFKSLVEKI